MNLLALNTAIEAVRAGEQGQGFVVIAQEILSLAVSCAEAARKVASRIRAIQNEITTVSQEEIARMASEIAGKAARSSNPCHTWWS